MNREEFLNITAFIKCAYPRETDLFTHITQIDVWYDFFREYTYSDVFEAVKRVVKRSVYTPTIADITSELNTANICQLTPGEAWQLTVRAIGRYGRDRQDAALEILPESVRVAVKSCGWRYLCNADTENAKRAFMREFAERTGRTTNERKALNG